jgi:two-component system, sensor histidine kinase
MIASSERPKAMTASSHPAGRPATSLLQRFVLAGHLRYWIISVWALALLTEVRPLHVAIWFSMTMAAGGLRGWIERLRPAPSPPALMIVALVSCTAWAVSPLLAWVDGGEHGATLAAVMLCAGFFLVFTQKRAAPREALVISAPYSVVSAMLILDTGGTDGVWTLAACVPVLGMALLIKVLMTQIKDAELRGAIAEQGFLIEALETARDQANAASEAKSNFLGVISHELRTPMNGVLGAAQLLEMARLPAPARDYVEIIRNSGEGLLSLLNDLLDATKIEAGKLDLDLQAVELADIERTVIGPFEAQAGAKGLAFSVNMHDVPAVVRADRLRLGQIVHNLLSNAIKFTEAGAVTLDISARLLDAGQAELRFVVTDTGAGIGAEDLSRLFQPFTQVDASSTRRFGGTGLGLTIARRIARQMGGDVTVTSEPARGSAFTFLAVVDVLDASPEAAPQIATESAAQALRLLVAEDHPVNRMVLKAWLATQGLECAVAENGEEALAIARQQPFDLILMDVNMPVMDGLTAIRELRSTPSPNRHTRVAILSASARTEDLEIGLASGADAYLTKPIDFAALSTLLNEERRSDRAAA